MVFCSLILNYFFNIENSSEHDCTGVDIGQVESVFVPKGSMF